MENFWKVINSFDLVDLTTKVDTFTWCNGQKENFMLQKLDRCLANVEWVNLFPNRKAFYLEWWCSDHKALVLNTYYDSNMEDCYTKQRSKFHFEEKCALGRQLTRPQRRIDVFGVKVVDLRLENGEWDVEFISRVFCEDDAD
ncbi:hypothetical protein F8388_010565 [Cannabis sativa]|uniref:Uncharacterized protein n=1 Tax=Cannabis sativa TaxID=3483 RepID=A0A7J6GPZ6_CANSA|nr:hypothetical protein F8388_010565 [Cannabis sativa]